jgi:hypothetical protein
VSSSAEVLAIRKTVRIRDRTERIQHHDFDATCGSAPPNRRDIAGSRAAAPPTFVIAAGLQDQYARILAKDTRQACQHTASRVAGDASVQDTDTASLRS